jgi:membrane-associated protein
METLHYLINLVLHLDQHLAALVLHYGAWFYGILFLTFFCETGIIVTAFLPGDSLLFATGALTASTSAFNIHLLFALLLIASVLGNSLNYWIGYHTGPYVFSSNQSWLFNKKHITRTHAFYERYGAKTIIIARFIPVIRTFAPFLAGIGKMNYRQFFLYNLCGAFLWIGGLLYASYLFGNVPLVKNHFSTIILLIIGFSILPAVIGFLKPCIASRFQCRGSSKH